jgi:uncharacterized protein (TIGR00369 family)
MTDAISLTLQEIQCYIDKSPYLRLVGTEITACANGYAELQLPFREDLTQHHGFIHGSIIGYLADAACAWAATSVAGDILTSEYKINLLSPAVGERFIGRGTVLKIGKSLIAAKADVFALKQGREKLIAVAQASLVRVETA